MGSSKNYWCDICGEKYDFSSADGKLIGVRFTDNTKFQLGNYKATDGRHVCMRCLGQLWNQAPTILAGG